MTTGKDEDWTRLGDVIERRIEALQVTRAEVQQRGGPSPATVRAIVNGRSTTLSPSKRRDLERAIEWAPGSIDIVLRGGDPEPISDLFVDIAHDLYEPPTAPEDQPEEPTDSLFEGRLKQHLVQFAELELDAVEGLLPIAAELHEVDVERRLTDSVLTLLDHIDASLTRVSNLSPGVATSYEKYVNLQARIRDLTKRHAVLSAEIGRGVGLDTGDTRSRVEGKLDAMSEIFQPVVEQKLRRSDHALAALESDEPKGPDPRGLDDGES